MKAKWQDPAYRETMIAKIRASRQSLKKEGTEYERNKDKYLKRTKIYYEKNRNNILQYQKNYYVKNKKKVQDRVAEYYGTNHEACLKRVRKYAILHPEIKKASYISRSRRKKQEAFLLSGKDIIKQFNLQQGKCFWCGEDAGAYHIDHVIPLSKGGSHSRGNIVISCPTCNLRKHTKLPIEFKYQYGFGSYAIGQYMRK